MESDKGNTKKQMMKNHTIYNPGKKARGKQYA